MKKKKSLKWAGPYYEQIFEPNLESKDLKSYLELWGAKDKVW